MFLEEVQSSLAAVMAEAASAANMKGLCFGVEAQLFLVVPNTERKEAPITTVTADNVSTCYAVWKESIVFEFSSAFNAHISSRVPSTRAGEHVGPRPSTTGMAFVHWLHINFIE